MADVYVLDGSYPDEFESNVWQTLSATVPHHIKIAGPSESRTIAAELAAEISKREQAGDHSASPIYLFIFNLGRFRDLRKDEDDFGFGGFDKDKPASPGKTFGDILRNGPSFGIHTLAWCDTYNNVNRWLSTQTLREFETRVVFQMSAADSSNLIDSPAAGRLGANRALLYLEDQGTLEKFRPYGVPSTDWLAQMKKQFDKRGFDQSWEDVSNLPEWEDLPEVM